MQNMPKGLRVVTGMCMIFTLFFPMAFVPFGTCMIDGAPVSFSEFWRRGGGPLFMVTGIVCALLAYGFIYARRWVRPLALAFGWSLVVISILHDPTFSTDLLIVVLLFGCLPAWYLYFRRPVRDYFDAGNKSRVA